MELTSQRRGAFEVPIWQVDLGDVLQPVTDELVATAHRALTERPAVNRPFRQSAADLPLHYAVFDELSTLLTEVVDGLILASFDTVVGVTTPRIRSVDVWVLEVDGADDWDVQAQQMGVFHNHPGATFSSVLFLDAGDGGSPSGTIFRSPHAHADPRLIAPYTVVPWAASNLIVFPSWLEHGPERPAPKETGRLTIATDFLT